MLYKQGQCANKTKWNVNLDLDGPASLWPSQIRNVRSEAEGPNGTISVPHRLKRGSADLGDCVLEGRGVAHGWMDGWLAGWERAGGEQRLLDVFWWVRWAPQAAATLSSLLFSFCAGRKGTFLSRRGGLALRGLHPQLRTWSATQESPQRWPRERCVGDDGSRMGESISPCQYRRVS